MSEKRNRTIIVRARLTPAEFGSVERAAEAMGVGVCTWARIQLMRAVGRKPSPPRSSDVLAKALARWTAEAAKIGNTLNWIRHALNRGVEIPEGVFNSLLVEIRALHADVIAVTKKENATDDNNQ